MIFTKNSQNKKRISLLILVVFIYVTGFSTVSYAQTSGTGGLQVPGASTMTDTSSNSGTGSNQQTGTTGTQNTTSGTQGAGGTKKTNESYQNADGTYKTAPEGIGQQEGSVGKNVAASALSCSVSAILGNLVSSTIGAALSELTGMLSGWLTDALGGIINIEVVKEVPTKDRIVRNNTGLTTSKETGNGKTGNILTTILNGIGSVSWDSIGWCLGIEIVRYISDATVYWIQNGFEGKPIFIDNPGSFFEGLADREAGNFIKEIVDGSTGINVCEPFKLGVGVAINYAYSNSGRGGRQIGCSLDQIKNNYDAYMQNWNEGGLIGLAEIAQPENNFYGAYEQAENQLILRINAQKAVEKLKQSWNNGYRTFEKCDESKKRADGSQDPAYCKTVTPGSLAKKAVESRTIDSSTFKTVLADEFDEIITQLVNQLVRIAVNEMFDAVEGQ